MKVSGNTTEMLSSSEYELLAKNISGTEAEVDVDAKGMAYLKSPTGTTGFTMFGDLTVLRTIQDHAKSAGLKVYGNTPGIVIWDRPRPTEKRNNAPDSGGTFYMNMSEKVSLIFLVHCLQHFCTWNVTHIHIIL